MSGTPKFSEAEIAEWKQKLLEAQRQRRAKIEARRPQEAEELKRQRQLEDSRHKLQIRVQGLLSELSWQWGNYYLQQAVTLQFRCQIYFNQLW
jgi:hypothetical protein